MAAAAGLIGWIRSRWRRFDAAPRVVGIDLARGLAVVGMLAAHLLVIEDFVASEPSTWVDIVNGRSSILFAVLAGVSIALVTGGVRPLRGEARARASGRIALRGMLLWLIGAVLVATGVPVYVILPAYAILFLLSLPFLGLPARPLFLLAAALGIVMPFLQAVLDASVFWFTPDGVLVSTLTGWHYPFPVWIAFLLAGMAVGRTDLRSVRTAVLLLLSGAALAVLGYTVSAATGSTPEEESLSVVAAAWTARAHSSGVLEVVGSGGFAVAVIGLCLLVCRTVLRWAVVPLRAVGAMPLTAYSVQLIVWAVVAASVLGDSGDLTGFRELEPFWPMTAGLLVACTLWALLIGRGPLEAGIARLSAWVVREPRVGEGVDRLDR